MAVASNNGDEATGGEEAALSSSTPPPDPGSEESGICARCHAPLSQPSAGGGCPRCMMRWVLAEEDNGGLDPIARTHEEVRRYSHFEIALETDGSLSELGHGAMGTTYRALDTVLHAAVALKVIGGSVADSPAVRARFLREARAAARLRHPNVASVFHYGEQEGECFYVMELVEGETLEQRVRRAGPLPAGMALEVTTQVAYALVAAEARGIVHRDLKPSNIMLSNGEEGRAGRSPLVKVIDFGLAKAIAADGPVPRMGDTRGAFVGTPAFASPEQFARNEDERIDTRSDIYSLGVTLWYLLCGKMPFVGKTLTEVHEQQTRQPLPLEQLKTAGVPPPVMALLCSMLAVAPAARPQTARELLDMLQRCQQQCLRASATRYARWAAALAAVALIILGGAVWREHTRPPTPPPDRSIAVLPFENLSSDPADAFYTTGVQDEITADLAYLPELTVTSPSSTKKYPSGKTRDQAAIGRELGVTHLLVGSCQREGQQMHIKLSLIDLHDPTHPWARVYDRQLADIFAVQGEIAHAVADQLQIALSPAEKAMINRPPTRDPVAYELYLRSQQGPEILPDPTAVRQWSQKEITLLDQAVARDPNFLLAYCQLVVAHDYVWSCSAGATPEELSVDHRTLAEASLRKARNLQPDAGEVHLATARHLVFIHDDTGQALVEANLARRALPNSARAESIAAEIDCDCGRWDDAVHSYERAVVLDPQSSFNRWQLAETYESLRRYEDYDRSMAMLLPIAPDGEKAEMLLERARGPVEGSADLVPLQTTLASISTADDPDGSTRTSWGLIFKLLEHDPDGIRRMLAAEHDATFWDEGVPFPHAWFEALAERMRGNEAGARVAFGVAHDAMVKFVADRPTNSYRLSLLAMIDAGLGNKDVAVSEARRACEMAPYATDAQVAPAIHCGLAIVYAWTGQPDLALKTLDEAVHHPAGEDLLYQPTYGDFRLNPVWDSLRSDPRFEALVHRLAPTRSVE